MNICKLIKSGYKKALRFGGVIKKEHFVLTFPYSMIAGEKQITRYKLDLEIFSYKFLGNLDER